MKKILLLLLPLLTFFACNRKKDTHVDKNYERYLEYKNIYTNYGKVPVDTTKAQLEDFLKHFPTNAPAWVFYGRLQYDLNQVPQALEAYRNAVESNPRYPEAYSSIGAIYNFTGSTDSAKWYLQKALDLKDSSAYTYATLAGLLLQEKNEQAAALADSALARADSNAVVYAALSAAYAKTGNKQKAQELYLQAFNLGLRDTAGFRQVLDGQLKLEDYYRKNKY